MSLQQSEPVALPHRSPGRQARSVAAYSLLTALMIITPMMVFVPAALFHCAIRNGRRAAWMAGAFAVAIAALYMAAVPQAPAVTNAAMNAARVGLAGLALSIVLPSLMVLPLVERAEKFGRVLVLLVMGSAVGLAVTELGSRAMLSFSPFAAQVAEAQRLNGQFMTFYRTNGVPADQLRMMEKWASYNMFLLPGFLLIMISFVFILSLLMLGRLKAWREQAALRGDDEALGAYLFRNFTLPDGLLFAFVLGGLTPLASGMLQKVAANTLTVVAFLYILQGLAIFRFFLAAMGAGFTGTMLGWLLLVLLTFTGVGPLLLGLAGLFDPFFHFRHFKKRKDDSHESHSD
ncbi:MAG: YybS family protein [Acidobacteriota bacterium]|nr:YybS family protein [Acidobacteriota bacterium]